jgi:hypothetical protein
MPASVVLFRAVLLTSVFTGFVGGFLDNVFPSLIPASMAQAFEALPSPPPPALFGAMTLFLVTFGGMIAAVLGLYFFQPWARQLAVWMTALGLLFHPLLGVSMRSGWAQLLLEVSSVLWGSVLAMSFVSSLSSRFAAPESPNF